ncbi:hypothetical protein ES703_02514 [subsurface metagenome]|nr:hypothetical protein [bacterium]
MLITGNDYAYTFDDLFPSLGELCYFSHSLSGKVGIVTENDWQLRAIGSIAQSVIPNGKTNIRDTSSLSQWGSRVTRWESREFSVGAELGQGRKFFREKGSIHLGLEFTWGKLSGDARFYRSVGGDAEWRTEHLTSKMFGVQGHIGINIPIVAFGGFTLGISPNLKGGAVKEQSIEGIPEGFEWKGPSTLSKWGVALGINLNYDGGEQQ